MDGGWRGFAFVFITFFFVFIVFITPTLALPRRGGGKTLHTLVSRSRGRGRLIVLGLAGVRHPHPSLPPSRGKGLFGPSWAFAVEGGGSFDCAWLAFITPILTFPRRGGRDFFGPSWASVVEGGGSFGCLSWAFAVEGGGSFDCAWLAFITPILAFPRRGGRDLWLAVLGFRC